MKPAVEQHDKSRRFDLAILLAVALCIGVYLIGTTVLISKDSVTFIKFAQKLGTAPARTMVDEFQHPGYPWLILAAHKIPPPCTKTHRCSVGYTAPRVRPWR